MNEANARRAQDELEGVLRSYLSRTLSVVLVRLKGPKARKDTRWWVTDSRGLTSPQRTEFKALDPDYVVPAKFADELAADLEPVLNRIAITASDEASKRLGQGDANATVNTVEKFVRISLDRLRALGERHAREVRTAVLDSDTTVADFDDLVTRVEAAHRRSGSWLLMSGRTLANALRNEATLQRGRALGVTHTQWLSKKDDRVRSTHVIADGQLRPLGKKFQVGRAKLAFPGDPSGLPQTWEEVAGCRCGLLLRKPDDAAKKILAMARQARLDPAAPAETLDDLRGPVARALDDESTISAPTGYGFPATAAYLMLDKTVIGYRVLDVAPELGAGQRLELPGEIVLGLAPPTDPAQVVLTVVVPAGVLAGVADGALILGRGTKLEVLGSDASGVTAQVAL